MATTMTPASGLADRRLPNRSPIHRRESAPPRLTLAHGQERALEEAYCTALGGQEAADVRAGKRAAHLLALRPLARALLLGRDPKAVVAYYNTLAATAMAICADAMRHREASLLDVSLEEEAAESALDVEQLRLAASPVSEAQLLTVIRCASRQAQASLSLAERCQRELSHVQRIEAKR